MHVHVWPAMQMAMVFEVCGEPEFIVFANNVFIKISISVAESKKKLCRSEAAHAI